MVQVSTGAEVGFTASAGYARVIPFLDRQLVLGGDVVLPGAGLDLSDYRVQVGALAPIRGERTLKGRRQRGAHRARNEEEGSGMTGAGIGRGRIFARAAGSWRPNSASTGPRQKRPSAESRSAPFTRVDLRRGPGS